MDSKPIILASQSPRRRELLQQAGIEFVCKTAATEEISSADNPVDVPICNAAAKADYIAAKHPDALVIGADTVVLFQNRIIGKPKDLDDARKILESLSGKAHQIITAVSLRCEEANYHEDFIDTTTVFFKPLAHELIEDYLSKVHVLDKAGAYALQEFGEMIIDHVDGASDNVIGLPVTPLLARLRQFR